MVTPEELAEAACDDQAWKQIQSRAATECRATCFRAAIKMLIGQIYRLGPNRLESARDQVEKRLGLDRLPARAFRRTQRHSRHLSAMMTLTGRASGWVTKVT
jgi:hypothetical protein